jgi:hypothetical protein
MESEKRRISSSFFAQNLFAMLMLASAERNGKEREKGDFVL